MPKLLNAAELDRAYQTLSLKPRKPKRALALGGGGPAVGISVGFLLALDEWNEEVGDKNKYLTIDYPVWVAGCVGGWLACLFHLCDLPSRAKEVEKKIRGFFRETDMYEHFPTPKTFTPDIPEKIASGLRFLIDPQRYANLVVPEQIARAYSDILNFYLAPNRWNAGDFSYLMLNSVLAPNPASRLLMSLLYKTDDPGLNKIWFGNDYSVLNQFKLEKLDDKGLPYIYINSYNIEKHQSQIYCNRPASSPIPTKAITMPALCASSALPYILSPVEVDNEKHTEGALIDSFCFEAIHRGHDDINEVWISRIVDHLQVKEPTNLLEALNNLIMLYAGTTSRHDIEIFVNEVNHHEIHLANRLNPKHVVNPIEIFQLPVEPTTKYFWSYENFDNSIARSKASCLEFLKDYATGLKLDGTRLPQRRNLFVRSSQFR